VDETYDVWVYLEESSKVKARKRLAKAREFGIEWVPEERTWLFVLIVERPSMAGFARSVDRLSMRERQQGDRVHLRPQVRRQDILRPKDITRRLVDRHRPDTAHLVTRRLEATSHLRRQQPE
jgi:hypothetical protein